MNEFTKALNHNKYSWRSWCPVLGFNRCFRSMEIM